MGKRLVLIGGGHAHMVVLANIKSFIEKGHSVTVVGPSAYHYYSGMGPGMLGGTYTPEDIRFATREGVEKAGGSFVLDYATHIDPKQRCVFLQSGETLSYDVLSFNAGSFVPWDCVAQGAENVFSVKPIETLIQAQNRIIKLAQKSKVEIGIVGGGPSSAEIAGNILQLAKEKQLVTPRISVYCRSTFMSHFPAKVRQMAYDSLQSRGVLIKENCPVAKVDTGQIIFDDGNHENTDLIFLALGVKPNAIFAKSGLKNDSQGGLCVNKFLQSPDYPEIFGGGDCISFMPDSLDKVGVYAVRQNPVLFHNLHAALDGTGLQTFDPGGDYLLIFNMGEGTGVLQKKWLTFGGRLAFMIKDYIDRRFMKQFQ